MFYLDLVGSAETISLLYHLAMKGKTVRDSESHSHSQVRIRRGRLEINWQWTRISMPFARWRKRWSRLVRIKIRGAFKAIPAKLNFHQIFYDPYRMRRRRIRYATEHFRWVLFTSWRLWKLFIYLKRHPQRWLLCSNLDNEDRQSRYVFQRRSRCIP